MTYDLAQVDSTNQLALRETLVNALETYNGGPKTIIVQLSLAVVGLALQLPSWERPVQTLIEKFGTNPTTVPTLLEFLTILPQEVTSNTRIPITVSSQCNDDFSPPLNASIRMQSSMNSAPNY